MQTAKATLHAVVCRRGRATSLAPMPNAQAKAIMTDKAKILRQCKACFSHALVIARFNTVAWRSHCQRAASGLLEVQRACRSVCRVPGVLCTAKATEGSQHLRLSCTDTWPSSENEKRASDCPRPGVRRSSPGRTCLLKPRPVLQPRGMCLHLHSHRPPVQIQEGRRRDSAMVCCNEASLPLTILGFNIKYVTSSFENQHQMIGH